MSPTITARSISVTSSIARPWPAASTTCRIFSPPSKQGTLSDRGGRLLREGRLAESLRLEAGRSGRGVQKRFLGDDDHPGRFGLPDQRGHAGPGHQRHRQEPILEQLRHRHHLGRRRRYIRPCSAAPARLRPGQGSPQRWPPGSLPAHFPLFARAHAVVHETGDHGSVVKFVDTVFGLTPAGQAAGRTERAGNSARRTWGRTTGGRTTP